MINFLASLCFLQNGQCEALFVDLKYVRRWNNYCILGLSVMIHSPNPLSKILFKIIVKWRAFHYQSLQIQFFWW
jgi:hypothetical protein